VRLALVGATGAVGETLLRVLDERAIPITELGAFASRDRGTVRFRGHDVPVRGATAEALGGYDVVLFASSDEASAELARGCADGGAIVIDNTATFRLQDGVPLVVPEINADALGEDDRILPVANCTAIVLTMALAPIARAAGLNAVNVATYQAASGAGRAGLNELLAGERALQLDEPEPEPRTFAAHLARNVIPQVGTPDSDGATSEEHKIAAETRKILGMPGLAVAAMAVRVPVRTAHSVAVFVETERPTSVAELARAFEAADGIVFHPHGIVTPRDVEGTDAVHVARLRVDPALPTRVQAWAVGDQLRKGAATNGVQILELLLARNLVPRMRTLPSGSVR
jgi:aspartate-semialdehyde dehydrogenase